MLIIIGIASGLGLVGIFLIVRKLRSIHQKVQSNDPDPIIFGKNFPKETVKNWDDIKIERALGHGNFGQVYKGFLHLNEFQR